MPPSLLCLAFNDCRRDRIRLHRVQDLFAANVIACSHKHISLEEKARMRYDFREFNFVRSPRCCGSPFPRARSSSTISAQNTSSARGRRGSADAEADADAGSDADAHTSPPPRRPSPSRYFSRVTRPSLPCC